MEKNAFFSWTKNFKKMPISPQVVQKHFDSSFLERNHFPSDEKFFVERTDSSGNGVRKNYLLCTTGGEILATFGNTPYKDLCAQQRIETVKHICKNFIQLFHK